MYSVTKFAVRAITEGLRYELNNLRSHIRVTVSKVERSAKIMNRSNQILYLMLNFDPFSYSESLK